MKYISILLAILFITNCSNYRTQKEVRQELFDLKKYEKIVDSCYSCHWEYMTNEDNEELYKVLFKPNGMPDYIFNSHL